MKPGFYLPILKSKLGEFTALSKLDNFTKNHIAPLFEVTPLEWDQVERKKPRTLDEHLKSFCNKLKNKWPSDNCFIDTHLLKWEGTDNTTKIDFIFDKLSECQIAPIPVVRVTSSTQFIRTINSIKNNLPVVEIAFRVTPNDVTSPEFGEHLDTLLKYIHIEPSQVHLIFDLIDSNFSSVEEITESILGILEVFPFWADWKSFTIAGTAFPSSSSIKEGTFKFNRNEWRSYKSLVKRLQKESFSRSVNYGDYSIVNPEYFEFNPKIMKASANIRYTHNDLWVVAKGKALKKAIDYLQYKKLSKEIYNSGLFLGERFSQGDLHLAKCVRDEEGPGAPSTWNWVGHNHHFTKVVSDLFANQTLILSIL
jgi:hypothetical protein